MKNNATAALPLEGEAYKYLGKAAALYTEIQVTQGGQRGGGGGGGGGQQSAEDLADLFELELDQNRNQYETVQRGEGQTAVRSRKRRLPTSSRNLPGGSRPRFSASRRDPNNPQANQRNIQQLRRDLEEMARQLEQMAQQDNQQAGQAARQLRQAAQNMQNAAQGGNAQQQQQAQQAAATAVQKANRMLNQNQNSNQGIRRISSRGSLRPRQNLQRLRTEQGQAQEQVRQLQPSPAGPATSPSDGGTAGETRGQHPRTPAAAFDHWRITTVSRIPMPPISFVLRQGNSAATEPRSAWMPLLKPCGVPAGRKARDRTSSAMRISMRTIASGKLPSSCAMQSVLWARRDRPQASRRNGSRCSRL